MFSIANSFMLTMCGIHFECVFEEYRILVEDYFFIVALIFSLALILLYLMKGEVSLCSCLGITHQPFRLMSKGGEL